MTRHVLKFGGTSVANIERLRHVALIVKERIKKGDKVAVVVSAMAGITNELLTYTQSINSAQITPEHDVVLSSGEQVTSGLLAMALEKEGVQARSFLAWQLPIFTDSKPSGARIKAIIPYYLEECIKQNITPVIAGFQGINEKGQLTTLGRGGSDTTAVALSISMRAKQCDIYTDVDGVYTADPRFVPNAKKLNKLSYKDMLEFATQGAKVLQPRSIELAMNNNLPLQVLSSFHNQPGTLIIPENELLERTVVCGLAHRTNQLKITLEKVHNKANTLAEIFSYFGNERIYTDMLTKSPSSSDELCDLSFIIQQEDKERVEKILNDIKNSKVFSSFSVVPNQAKVSIIGSGIKGSFHVPNTLFKTLANNNIQIDLLSMSEIKISFLVHHDYLKITLESLHSSLKLDRI